MGTRLCASLKFDHVEWHLTLLLLILTTTCRLLVDLFAT
jgi:hypothetical protein